MEHDLRFERLEHTLQPRTVAHVADDTLHVEVRVIALQILARLEHAVLAVPEHDEASRPKRRDLPADLRPDRSAASGNEHSAIPDVRLCAECRPGVRATEQIGNLHFAQPVDRHAPSDELEYAGDD